MSTSAAPSQSLAEPRGVAAWLGFALAIPLALATYAVMHWLLASGHAQTLDDAAKMKIVLAKGPATAAIMVLMGVLWITEAIPLAATSLLPLVLFPLCGILTFAQAASPFANNLVYVYFGGFLIALAIERWQLHRRLALHTLLAVGTSPARLVGGLMLATALLSMWISNTATTAMMLPLALSLVTLLSEQASTHESKSIGRADAASFATAMMLGIAYAATIGGLGTLIGTPTNVALAGFAAKNDIPLSFAGWAAFGTPLAAVYLIITWLLLTKWLYRLPARQIEDSGKLIRSELAKLGAPSRGEIVVALVFGLTALLWIIRGAIVQWQPLLNIWPAISQLDDGIIALFGALLLFIIPIYPRRGVFALDWEVTKRMPWGVLLLFGGGLSLAEALNESKLSDWIGAQVSGLDYVSPVLLVVIVTATVIFASEFTSNVAIVNAFLPIMLIVARALKIDPLLLLVPTTAAASYAFMLPVGTPPNAIAFGTGYIKQSQMMRAGLILNLLGVVLIPLAVYTLGVWVLGIK